MLPNVKFLPVHAQNALITNRLMDFDTSFISINAAVTVDRVIYQKYATCEIYDRFLPF